MYIIACLRKLLQSFIDRIFKQRVKNNKGNINKKLVSRQYTRKDFNRKQLVVIDKAIQAGVDYNRIAKGKYSAEQMVILFYGLLLDVDISEFSSFAMTPMEMEYHLYMKVIDRYLGDDYLTEILCDGKYSVADKCIKNRMRDDINKVLSTYFQVSSTAFIEDKSNVPQDEVEKRNQYLEFLRKMCSDRDINPYLLEVDDIATMSRTYERLESNRLKDTFKYAVPIEKFGDKVKLIPDREEIVGRYSLEERNEPILMYIKGSKKCEYFQINRHGETYLFSKGYVLIKL